MKTPNVKAVFPVFLVLLLCLSAGCSNDSETRRNDALASQQLAYAFMKEGRPARALQELAKAEALTPDDPEIHNMMGLAYWAHKEYGLAEMHFKRALELKPEFSEGANNLGTLYMSQARYPEAVTALEKALKNVYYNSYEAALSNLGWAYYKLGRVDDAKKRLEESIEVNPSVPQARLNLGIVLFDLGKDDDALAQIDAALRIFPDFAEAHLQKGIILNRKKDRQGAIESFRQAWKLGALSDTGKTAKTYLEFLEK